MTVGACVTVSSSQAQRKREELARFGSWRQPDLNSIVVRPSKYLDSRVLRLRYEIEQLERRKELLEEEVRYRDLTLSRSRCTYFDNLFGASLREGSRRLALRSLVVISL